MTYNVSSSFLFNFFLVENSGLFHDKLDTLHLRVSLYTILKLTDTPTHRLPPLIELCVGVSLAGMNWPMPKTETNTLFLCWLRSLVAAHPTVAWCSRCGSTFLLPKKPNACLGKSLSSLYHMAIEILQACCCSTQYLLAGNDANPILRKNSEGLPACRERIWLRKGYRRTHCNNYDSVEVSY